MNTLLALTITCAYSFMGAPFTQVAFGFYDDGTIEASALITPTGGISHKESLTQVAAAPEEMIHAWISKDTQNAIELIVYKTEQPNGRSKLVNPSAPIGNTMWGSCSGLTTTR